MLIGDLYALGGAATFAFSSSIIKRLNIVGSPIQLNFVRTLIGAILFLSHLIITSQVQQVLNLPGLIILYLIISVTFNVVLGDTSFFEAQNRLGVKIATPLVNIYPFGTIILAVIFLGETVSTGLLFGGVILILGVILLSLDRIDPVEEENDYGQNIKLMGLLLIAFAILCYALGVVFTTIATEDISAVVANSVRLPFATLALFSMSITQSRMSNSVSSMSHFRRQLISSRRRDQLLLIIAGIFGTYLSSLFLVLSVQEIGASRSSVLFSTGPFFALPLAILWLRERISWMTLLGTILTVIGLWIILI